MPEISGGFFDESFREMAFSQSVSVAGGLIAGVALSFMTGNLSAMPGLLVAIPGFLEMRGSISGSFSSRLSSGLFLGVINTREINTRLIRSNVAASFALAVIVSLFLGLIAWSFNFLLFGDASLKVLLVILLGGALANAIEIPVALFATLRLFREGHDPNNIMGPFITSVGDIVSIACLALWMVVL